MTATVHAVIRRTLAAAVAVRSAVSRWVGETRGCLQPPAPAPQRCTAARVTDGFIWQCGQLEHPGSEHEDPVYGTWQSASPAAATAGGAPWETKTLLDFSGLRDLLAREEAGS